MIERLCYDKTMRRLCGWYNPGDIPCESMFSRTFGEFAENKVSAVLHEEIIRHFLADERNKQTENPDKGFPQFYFTLFGLMRPARLKRTKQKRTTRML